MHILLQRNGCKRWFFLGLSTYLNCSNNMRLKPDKVPASFISITRALLLFCSENAKFYLGESGAKWAPSIEALFHYKDTFQCSKCIHWSVLWTPCTFYNPLITNNQEKRKIRLSSIPNSQNCLSSSFWHAKDRCSNSPFAVDKQHQSSRRSF